MARSSPPRPKRAGTGHRAVRRCSRSRNRRAQLMIGAPSILRRVAGEARHDAPPGPPGRGWLSWSTAVEIAGKYWNDRPMEAAAALSYYTLLSLAPLVLMAVAVAGLVFERAAVETQ